MIASRFGRLSARIAAVVPRRAAATPAFVSRLRSTRSISTARDRSFEEWSAAFHDATAEVRSEDIPFEESADRLRELTKTDLLRATDLRDHPERFFEAHRILARHAVDHGPGFWIRFTVHYNLFAGTVLAVGTEDQVAELDTIQATGKLGCFSLTEKLAGVQSGLVVQTTVTWDPARQTFVLNTPHVGARKNWISQGFVADKTVVLADLVLDGESRGPHAFLMDFRVDGKLVDGITVDDMGKKTTGNDLDNAWIAFDHVELPRSAMLGRYAEIDADGKYVSKDASVRAFDMIGQRLYTGRVAVAQAALEYRRQLYKQTKEYSDSKAMPAGGSVLSDIPHLRDLYAENDQKQAELDDFVKSAEAALNICLREEVPPPPELVDAIATCKVRAVEDSIAMCFRLKQEVGSFALMDDAGFKHMDFLQCCKFAEGDSRILMQKLARDRLKQGSETGRPNEDDLVASIGARMSAAVKDGASRSAAWDAEYKSVYALAEAVMTRIQQEGNFATGPAPKL